MQAARAVETAGLATGSAAQGKSLREARGRLFTRLSRETTSGRLIPQIDGLRFAAIGLVILFHLNGYLAAKWPLGQTGSLPQSSWLARAALVGFHGVELFFVISGFILALPFAAHHCNGAPPVRLKHYYLRRLTRLEPPYLVTLILLFVLMVVVQGKSAAALFPHLAAGLVYSHSLIYGATNGVAWSLEIEVQFYLLVPLLTLLFAIRRQWLRRSVFVGSILAIQGAQVLWIGLTVRGSLSILAFLQFFLAGFLLADIFLCDWKESPQPQPWWDCVTVAGWPLLLTFLRFDWFTDWVFPFAVLLLYCAAFKGWIGRRLFSNRWITLIGGMCYSIYLIHYEVISAVGRITKNIGAGRPYWIYLPIQLLLVGLPIVFVCGLYFALLERPCMRRDWPQRLRKQCQETARDIAAAARRPAPRPNVPPASDPVSQAGSYD